MKVYEQIKDMLCDELEEIAKKKELTSSNLDVLDKAVDIIKDIDTINAMEQEYGSEGYSNGYSNGYYSRYPYYMYDGEMGNSYARGRGANAKRDSMGRYSRDDGYSMNDGYSRDTKEELRMMMDRAKDEREKEALRKAYDSMR